MTHWLDFRTGCRKRHLWTDKELDLVREGKLVPGRSAKAYQHKRLSLGIRLGPRPERTFPYNAPKRAPGELPFPKWWKLAHNMRLRGYWVSRIAILLNKNVNTVRIALFPEVREEYGRIYSEKYVKNTNIAKRKERDKLRSAARDYQRSEARRIAREEWRASGGDPRALEGFYRRFDCL